MNPKQRTRVPWGLVGAVVVATAVESAVARHDLSLVTTDGIMWRTSRQAADRRSKDCGVLAFGSSMMQVGFMPRVVERETGRPAYNLSVVGGQIPCSYFWLRRAIEAGAKPSAVVVDAPPNFLNKEITEETGCWAEALDARDCLDLAWATRDPAFFARVALERALPSYAHRRQIARMVVAACDGTSASNLVENLFGLRNINRNRGSYLRGKNPAYHGEVPKYHALLDTPWVCNPVQLDYLGRFIGLAGAHGIKVYWVMTPFCPGLQERREQSGLEQEYDRVVRSFLSHENLVVVDGRHSRYAEDMFMDLCHLDPEGAYVFTEEVAAVLRRPGAGRWVTLPPFQYRPVGVPMESSHESGVAMLRVLPPEVITR